jgi:hypothetical protein
MPRDTAAAVAMDAGAVTEDEELAPAAPLSTPPAVPVHDGPNEPGCNLELIRCTSTVVVRCICEYPAAAAVS